VADPENSGAAYLARTAYRTYREWTEPEKFPPRHFDQLDEKTRRAWLEVAIVIWHEIHVNSRPPVEPSPTPWPRRSGKASAFSLLHNDELKDK
jgi:hypothetical protein